METVNVATEAQPALEVPLEVPEEVPQVTGENKEPVDASGEDVPEESAAGPDDVPGSDAPEESADGPDEQSAQEVDEGPLEDLSDDVDVRAYEEDPDPTEEYDEDGGFVVKDADVEAVIAEEVVLHADAEITVRNFLPEGKKRARRPPQRYEPVETPLDDVDRPAKRRKVEEPAAERDQEDNDSDDLQDDVGDDVEGDETTDDEEYVGSTDTESESEESESEEEEEINIID